MSDNMTGPGPGPDHDPGLDHDPGDPSFLLNMLFMAERAVARRLARVKAEQDRLAAYACIARMEADLCPRWPQSRTQPYDTQRESD